MTATEPDHDFDTGGRLVREYPDRRPRLSPLATIEVVDRERDLSGGSGTNSLVEGAAGLPISRPVIQAVMIGAAGNPGISVCEGSEVMAIAPARGG